MKQDHFLYLFYNLKNSVCSHEVFKDKIVILLFLHLLQYDFFPEYYFRSGGGDCFWR